MLSGSTSREGWRSASSPADAQWVVTRRPSSRPASASRKAPVQTEVTRRERPAARATQRTSAASRAAACTPRPPATTRVSMAPRQREVALSGAIAIPLLVVKRPSAGATISVE